MYENSLPGAVVQIFAQPVLSGVSASVGGTLETRGTFSNGTSATLHPAQRQRSGGDADMDRVSPRGDTAPLRDEVLSQQTDVTPTSVWHSLLFLTPFRYC